MSANLATVVKDGELVNLADDQLCKGDLVVFQAGDLVPADLKLLEAWELEVDEFDVTGEIMPVAKKPVEEDVFLYLGSRITKGAGKGLVVAVGEQTEFGQVLKQSWERKQSLSYRFFKWEYLIPVVLLLPAIVILLKQSQAHFLVFTIYACLSLLLIFLQNYELFDRWMITSELKTCARQHIQIRDPDALVRMHEIDTFCFDKTGVLTTRHMDVQKFYFADAIRDPRALAGDGHAVCLTRLACALCHDVIYYEKIDLANPIDKALISIAQVNGLDVHEALLQYPRIYDQPFDSENRYMASGFLIDGQAFYFVKGDPAVVLKMCENYLTSTGELKQADLNFWQNTSAHIDAITQNGGMVIALATTSKAVAQAPENYTFLCLLHFDNSLQPGVPAVIRGLRSEGKRSLLLTGDRDETAARVGAACGITTNPHNFLTGKVIDRMGLAEVARQSDYCSIFARLLPSHKATLIRLLQGRDQLVAMVGDGPNDGLALKAADISISFFENSSPVARQLSKILINDLSELLILLESSSRLKQRADEFHAYRALLLVFAFLSLYLWAVILVFHP